MVGDSSNLLINNKQCIENILMWTHVKIKNFLKPTILEAEP
jgi:hypothetical protein